ncbi:MAG: DegT/DnrJ/EryC1/StrS family aminotransferase [Planctomycetes bacterium]|nr:DegT/DnrJ/EryC1/StrS family aminotransferase [Planctomycetota bacterium]
MGKLAVKGGKPVRVGKPWPSWPVHDERERKALLGVLESGKWWWGEKVKEFERKFADYQDAKFGISCTNGTAALEIACVAAGIGAGDEVITSPYTFMGTASAILRANAVPVFVDTERDTMNIDADQIEAAITDKTRAIMPVHFGGLPCDMDKINRIAKKHDLVVIEDAAHSWGTKWRGKGAGALGDLGGFSFQMSKNITGGEGGIVLTDSEALADQALSYANCGRGKGKPWYEHYLLGSNYRMTEFQAAILLAQLQRLPEHNQRRAANAKFLSRELAKIDGIQPMREDKRATERAYHLYGFLYDAKKFGGAPREKFRQALSAEGVPNSPGYPHPLYKNPLFQKKGAGPDYCPVSCPYYGRERDYTKVVCPNAERLCQEVVWFTQTMLLGSEDDMADIVAAVRKVRANARELKG